MPSTPAAQVPAPTFRTEISFRRDLPQASPFVVAAVSGADGADHDGSEMSLGHAGFAPHEEPGEPSAPGQEVVDAWTAPLTENPAAEPDPGDLEAVVEDAPPAKTPLLKRQITFGRKRSQAHADATQADDADSSASLVDRGSPSDDGEATAGHDTVIDLPVVTSAEALEQTPEVREEKVSFLKREIGFGRKRQRDTRDADSHDDGTSAVALPPLELVAFTPDPEPELEDTADAQEPGLGEIPSKPGLLKREISFRRRRSTTSPADDPSFGEPSGAAEPETVDDVLPDPFDVTVAPPRVESAAEAADLEIRWADDSVDHPESEVDAADLDDLPRETPDADVVSGAFDTLARDDDRIVELVPRMPDPPVAEIELDAPVEHHDGIRLQNDEVDLHDKTAEMSTGGDLVGGLGSWDEHDDLRASIDELQAAEAPAGKPAKKPKKAARGRGGAGKSNATVGLKIGASQIAAVVIQNTDEERRVVQVARRSLEAGIVVDGEVRDPEALSSILAAFFDEHRLPRRNVRVGVASNRVGVRTVELAGIDDPVRFDNAVRFKAHEVLPVAVNESVLDYRVLDEKLSETGETTKRVLLVVAPRDQVEPYVEVCRAAGLRIGGIDLEALGLLRAFSDPFPIGSRLGDDTATVIVAIGHESTTLLVAGGGMCEFTRVFDWGGSTLREAIAAELEIGPAEAAAVLRHLSLKGPGWDLPTLDEDSRARALNVVRARLSPFARELVASLQFYQTQPDSLGIGELVISGGTSRLEGLDEALHQMIGVSVRVGDPFGRVDVACEIDESLLESLGSLAVPVGLAIEDLPSRSVNLLPTELQRPTRKTPRPLVLGAPVLAALPIVALVFMFTKAGSAVDQRQLELDGLRSQIAALPTRDTPKLEPGVDGTNALRAGALSIALGQRMSWDGMLNDISRVLPGNVWLTGLTAKGFDPNALPAAIANTPKPAPGVPAVPQAPTAVTIEGLARTQFDVATVLARLAAVSSLRNVALESSAKEMLAGAAVVRFVIRADLNRVGGVL